MRRSSKEIADMVGYLPMALEMLAARLGEPLADADSVLTELKKSSNRLLVRAFQDAAGRDLGRPEGVYSAITGTLNGLAHETRKVISPFGYLADAPVPLPLASVLTGLDQDGLSQLLAECGQQSVLSGAGDQITVHALTAAAIAITNDDDALDRAINSDITRIAAINTDDPVAMRAEISHHEALRIHAKNNKTSDDHSVLAFSSSLANGYGALGRMEEAVRLFEETLAATVRVLGPEHPDTLTSRSNLAVGYMRLGRTKEAVQLDEETLEARVRVLGPEHPETLASRNNLAIGYRRLGQTEEAVQLDEETLEAMVRVLGPERPETLASRNGLARGYHALGRTEEAVKLDEESLEASTRALGPEHPDTLISRSNLAIGYGQLGRTQEAVELDEETLEARVRVLGLEHPETLGSWRNLIMSYRAAERHADALAADERFPADA